MITSDTNFRGNYDSIEAVWEAIPYGGVEGDYLNIQGVKYRWNKYLAMWENAEVVTETPARETVTFDEDVNMQNNLTVAGVLRAKKFVVDDLPTGIEDVEIVESAVSGGNNVITFTYTNGESQTFIVKNGKTQAAFAVVADALDKTGWDTAKCYLVLTETEGEFDVYSYENEEWNKVDTIEIDLNYDVVQTTGQSTSAVMSQKAVTDSLRANTISFDNLNSKLQGTNVQSALSEVGNTLFETNDIKIAAGQSINYYYTYNNGVISTVSSNVYICWSPIDISSYYAVKIKFYLNPSSASARSFFTDENNLMVGDFLFNTSGDYMTYVIPQGAKKLYWTTDYHTQTDIALYGVYRTDMRAEKISYDNTIPILAPKNVQGALDEIGNTIFALNDTRIAAGLSTKYYYTYNNGVINTVSSANIYRCWSPIDISSYYAVKIKFFLAPNPDSAVSFFTDENNLMVGDFLYNTSGDYATYVIPQGAKKLYWTINYFSQTDIAIYGVTKTEKNKEISILFIGNSLTQDAVSYAPILLKELAPEVNFKFYMWYNGGYNLTQQLADFNANEPCDIFSVCESSIRWTNFDNNTTMQTILNTYKFDIVCLQEYFNIQETADVDAFNGIIEYIEDHYTHPFKVITFFHAPQRSTAETVFNRTKVGNALLLKETVAEDMIASGIAIYRAMATSLDSLGDNGHLSPDDRHAQEGLPCMLEAYVTAMWVLKQVGITMSVNNASAIVDNSNYASINVPGPNLGSGVVVGTTEQVRLSQKVAIKAYKEGEYFVNGNLTEYT